MYHASAIPQFYNKVTIPKFLSGLLRYQRGSIYKILCHEIITTVHAQKVHKITETGEVVVGRGVKLG